MYNNNLENQEALNEKKFKELTIQLESMEREYSALIAQLQIDISKIGEYLDNRDNFDEDSWKAMEDYKKTLDEKYDSIMAQKNNPAKVKDARELMKNHRPHWIHVR